MKKKNLMLLLVSALLMGFTFTGCGSDDDNTPKKPDTDNPGKDDGGKDDGTDDPGEVTDPTKSLDGSNYFVLQLDETSAKKIEGKVQANFYANATDGETEAEAAQSRHLYIWGDVLTYDAGTPQGPNFYGLVEGWPSFVVTSVGWSGAGYQVPAYYKDDLLKLMKIADEPEKYYLHIAMKTKQTGKSHLLMLNFGEGNTGKVAVGSVPFEDAGVSYQPFANITTDGEWNEINIPITEFMKTEAGGLDYSNKSDVETKGTNVFSFLSGGVTGTTLDYDALFIYKK